MKPRFNFYSSILAISTAALFVATTAVQAVDYSYGTGSGTTPFTITASEQARQLGYSWDGNIGGADFGAVYYRDRSDRTFMRFDLSSLAGTAISGNVSLSLTVDAWIGGAINNGQVSTANAAWSYNGGAPGITAIPGTTGPNASFNTDDIATWTIPGSTLQGYIGSPSFNGLVVSADTASSAHFKSSGTLTGTTIGGQVVVLGATDWSTAAFNSGTSTLNVAGSSNVSGGNVTIQSGATVAMSETATMDAGNFSGAINNNGILVMGSSTNQALSGVLSGSGILTKSGAGTLTLTGTNSFSGGVTIDGGSLAVSSSTFGSGPVTINNGGTLETSGQWTFGGTNPWNVPSTNIPSLTVNTGGTLHLSESDGFANGISNLYLNGGSVTGGGGFLVEGLGALFLYNGNQQIIAGGATTSTISARIGLDGNSNIITVEDASTLNITGVVANCTSWSNNGGFTKAGDGTLALSGTNSYTGNTTVAGGTLSLGNGTTNTSLANTADVTVDSGCTLNLNYTGTDTIDELWLGGVLKSPGIYGSGNSGGLITGTGTLTVNNGPSALDYNTWGDPYGLATGSESGDLDNDGLTNQQEYAFGLIPNSGTSVNPNTSQLSKATGQFSYQRRDNALTGLTYTVWYSTNLVSWTQDTGALQPEGTSNGNGVEIITVTLTPALLSNPKLFIQIRAQ